MCRLLPVLALVTTPDLYLVTSQCTNGCCSLLLPTVINFHSHLLPVSILSTELIGVLMTTEGVETTLSMLLYLSIFSGSIYPGLNLETTLHRCFDCFRYNQKGRDQKLFVLNALIYKAHNSSILLLLQLISHKQLASEILCSASLKMGLGRCVCVWVLSDDDWVKDNICSHFKVGSKAARVQFLRPQAIKGR